MAGKLKVCKHCGEQIAKSAKVCPKCGGKNSNPAGCIIAVIVVIVVFGGAIAQSGGGRTQPPTSSGSTASSDSSGTGSAPASDSSGTGSTPASDSSGTGSSPASDSSGTTSEAAVSGPAQIYDALSEVSNVKYELSDKSRTFMTEHSDLFPAASMDACTPYIDYSIEYKHLAKAADNYNDKLMSVTGRVVQIEEVSSEKTGLDKSLSCINLIAGDGNQFYIYYLDSVDVFEDDYINVIGLPMEMSSFTNTDGGSTLCPVIAGSYIEKAAEY